MAQRPNPPRGMRDLLPRETAARRTLLGRILPVYERYGFQEIETPALEEIERLLGSEGGDNEKLIYKVLKRGLTFEQPVGSDSDLVDLGLRYDLTVPLARFYATHSAELPSPFKAIQTGAVWRAERPQKGRYRQFVQCDIDVLGDPSVNAEIELVCATAEALRAVEVGAFTVRINHRGLLESLVALAGFGSSQFGAVLVAIDKLDKVGIDGVAEELHRIDDGTPAADMAKMLAALAEAQGFDATLGALPEGTDLKAVDDLRAIAAGVTAVLPDVPVELDATLVRGQGYYTGAIFEVQHDELSGSLAGGGRYDRMIAKLSGVDVPAVGFSIGFERLFDILGERMVAEDSVERIVLLHDPGADVAEVSAVAHALRGTGTVVRREAAVKNRAAQLSRLEDAGFTHWALFRSGEEIRPQPLSREGSQ